MLDSVKIMVDAVEIGAERDEAIRLLSEAVKYLTPTFPLVIEIKAFLTDIEKS